MYKKNKHEIKNYYLSVSVRFKVYMLKLFILVSLAAIILDFWLFSNIDYTSFFELKTVVFIILVTIYILFPLFLSLDTAIYITIVSVTLLIILSLSMVGLNKYFVIFSLAIVPIYSFFFFGAYLGLIWSLSVIFFLTLSMIIAMIDQGNTFFNAETMAQISISYISLTYLYYRMELGRSAHEKSLSDLLDKKTMLLKELHHRSKNNLQTVMGLLESQALRVENKECKKVLTSQRLRLKTMSMVHESLSASVNYEKIEMSGYLDAIAKYNESIFGHKIIVDFDKIYLSMEDAMNIGLFFNEALSNASEHAYGLDEKGEIGASLKVIGNSFEISVRDYGKGFDTHKKSNSLGLILMEDICLFFNNSVFSIENSGGTHIKAKFNLYSNYK